MSNSKKDTTDVARKRARNLKQSMGKTLDLKIKLLVNDIVTSFKRGTQRALATQSSVDTVIHDVLEKNPTIKNEIKCRQGCGACCYQQVQITDSEKDLITTYMGQRNIFPSPEESKRLGRQSRASSYGDWGELRHEDKKCIFLDETNSCKIYPVRPMACRSYLVASDPVHCDHSVEVQKVDIVQVNQADLIILAAFYADDKDGKNESLPQKLSPVFS